MEILNQLVPWIGVGLCLIALVQLAHWSAQSLDLFAKNPRQFSKRHKELIQSLKTDLTPGNDVESTAGWKGYRNFRVSRIDREANNCKSIYLIPEDDKAIPTFRPGQHLAIRFQIPGQPKSVVRCYSLSCKPGTPDYRITVKKMEAPLDQPGLPAGLASSFIHQTLQVGDRLEVKSPSGHFYIDEHSDRPVVLLAGGIGITPMVSILEHLVSTKSHRQIVMAYGVRHSLEHPFSNDLRELRQRGQLLLMNCYSDPLPDDVQGDDYDIHGFVSVDLIRELLPNQDCDFYLCGPPPFMQSLNSGLLAWGVSPAHIHTEAFGPASLIRGQESAKTVNSTPPESVNVKFSDSEVNVLWNGETESLLDLADANGIEIDSGCRAGSCGSCVTEIVSGSVKYIHGHNQDCPTGHCLVCIATPDGPVELRA